MRSMNHSKLSRRVFGSRWAFSESSATTSSKYLVMLATVASRLMISSRSRASLSAKPVDRAWIASVLDSRDSRRSRSSVSARAASSRAF